MKNSVTGGRKKIMFCAQHPVAYHTGIYQEFTSDKRIDTFVAYYSRMGVDAYFEPEFGVKISKKIDLLDGHRYTVLKNIGTNAVSGFFSRINPSIVRTIIIEKPDLIIIHGYSTFTDILALITAGMFRIDIAMKGEAVLRNDQNPFKQLIKKVVLRFLFAAPKYFLYSCGANQKFWEAYGVDRKRCLPFFCAVDNNKYRTDYQNRIKQRYEIVSKCVPADYQTMIKILWVGRLTARKNPHALIKAMAEIGRKDALIIMAGDGDLKEDLQRCATKYDCPIMFTGFVDSSEIGYLYTISDIFVNSSQYDPSPKTVNEAMNYCLPLVVSKHIGTLNELLLENENGYSFDPNDAIQLSEKLARLIGDKEMRESMGKKSSEIINNYTYENNKDAVVDMVLNCK